MLFNFHLSILFPLRGSGETLLPFVIFHTMKKMNKFEHVSLAIACAALLPAAGVYAQESENQVLSAISGTTFSGYIDTSMGWQFGDKTTSAGRVNDAADRQNGFNLNVAQLRFSKELDEDASIWSAGYAASLLIGPTAQEMSYADGEFALQHAYVDLRAPIGNGLDFRFGAFESLLGYEALETYTNPNYSRSYGAYLEHGQSVGGLAAYTFDINGWLLSMTAGIANAFDNPVMNGRASNSARLSYMGALDLIFPESTGFLEGTEVYVALVNGINSDPAMDADSQPNNFGLNAWIAVPLPVEGLSFAFNYDYAGNGSRGGSSPVGSSWANAYAGYLIYDVTDKLTFANRFEYAEGSAGAYDSIGDADRSWLWGADQDQFIADTFTVAYKLWDNVITRAEFRWDHDLSGNKRMTDDGTRENAFGISANVTYMF